VGKKKKKPKKLTVEEQVQLDLLKLLERDDIK
jgi:hypothetical protein